MGFRNGMDARTGLLAALLVLCGCGSNPCNSAWELQVSPASATVNHSAAPPKNQTQFVAVAAPVAQAGCAIPQIVAREYATWSNPDPSAIQISSASDLTNGTAVCKAPTNGPVTLKGTFAQLVPPMVSGPAAKTVQLTCY
ncbi:MAG: hypothetical protein WCF17_02600 [Terracidiphilus sp.]